MADAATRQDKTRYISGKLIILHPCLNFCTTKGCKEFHNYSDYTTYFKEWFIAPTSDKTEKKPILGLYDAQVCKRAEPIPCF